MILKMAHKGVGLCATCREGHTEEYENGDTATFCSVLMYTPRRITTPVVRCSDYDQSGHLNKYELEKLAWTIQTDKSGLKVGFAPPKKKDDDA